MKTQTIEVEGLPEGYNAVSVRIIDKINPSCSLMALIDIEKIQPRRISFDENALNEAGWAIVEKYNNIVGEGMGGRLFNNLKPLLKIGISEYFRLTEVKETDIPKDEPKLSLTKKDMLELIEHIKLGGQLNHKIAEFIKEN